MLNDFKRCPQRFYQKYIHHWKATGIGIHIHAGSTFAKGLETVRREFYERGAPAELAIARGVGALLRAWGSYEAPDDYDGAKDPVRMAGALVYYFDQLPLGVDTVEPLLMPSGRRAIEFSFAEPVFDVSHPETGDPIIFAGRSDMLCRFSGGQFVEDDKTTKGIGATWASKWDLRGQFTGYCWAAERAGIHIDGVLVRGIAILKTKYEIAQAVTYRDQLHIQRWYEAMVDSIERMKLYWDRNYWPHDFAEACDDWGGCEFKRVCTSAQPMVWLNSYFEQRIWNPLTREETLLVSTTEEKQNG
jgi:hypothetical protein